MSLDLNEGMLEQRQKDSFIQCLGSEGEVRTVIYASSEFQMSQLGRGLSWQHGV